MHLISRWIYWWDYQGGCMLSYMRSMLPMLPLKEKNVCTGKACNFSGSRSTNNHSDKEPSGQLGASGSTVGQLLLNRSLTSEGSFSINHGLGGWVIWCQLKKENTMFTPGHFTIFNLSLQQIAMKWRSIVRTRPWQAFHAVASRTCGWALKISARTKFFLLDSPP